MSETSDKEIKIKKLPTYKFKQQEIKIEKSNKLIYGIAYIPIKDQKRFPLAIFSHGLGDSYISNYSYIEQLATHGIATYSFDFRGGGGDKSNGKTTEMSVMTEASDLEDVLNESQKWDFVDTSHIVLLGHSQGALVSSIIAAKHPSEISGVVLLSPAFSLTDLLHKKFHTINEVPQNFYFLYIDAGIPYAQDIWNYDPYKEIGKYDKKVLLIHGNADDLVPISYSERALNAYKDAKLAVIDGAGHEFKGNELEKANIDILDYLCEIGSIN